MKRSFVQSEYITAIWAWFMVLAAKAAEPVLVLSVLCASVKLLPVVHLPPQFDVVVFIAQFNGAIKPILPEYDVLRKRSDRKGQHHDS